MFPVGGDKWAWCGPGGHWSKRIAKVIGVAAVGPFGSGLQHGTKNDESVVWFKDDLFQAVAQVVQARRRRSTWRHLNPQFGNLVATG